VLDARPAAGGPDALPDPRLATLCRGARHAARAPPPVERLNSAALGWWAVNRRAGLGARLGRSLALPILPTTSLSPDVLKGRTRRTDTIVIRPGGPLSLCRERCLGSARRSSEMRNSTPRIWLGILICVGFGTSARGQGIIVPSAGPINSAMAGASTAAPVDFGGSYWNPAILSGLDQQEVLIGAALAFPSIHLQSSLAAGSVGGVFPPTNRF